MPISTTKPVAVPWQNHHPEFVPENAYHWRWKRPARPNRSFAKIETALNWPLGVVEILHTAFAAGLSRSTGWDLSEITSNADLEAFRVAAKIFRRGVATSKFSDGVKTSHGTYLIRFVDSQDAVDAAMDQANFVLVDRNVEAAWPYLEERRSFHLSTQTEQEKDLTSVARIVAAWQSAGRPQRWLVIGGGLSSDLAGFAASLVNCQLTVMPTTLLAMIDASVGGKTGVNFPPFGKNQVGAFHFPREVIIWNGWLQTISRRALLSGGSECLKHALLHKSKLLAKKLAQALASQDIATITALLPTLVGLKAEIVAQDPTEQGIRAVLNLGHTLGHAIEGVSGEMGTHHFQTIDHGEAVGVGICYAALLSKRLGYLRADDCEYIWNLFKGSGCLLSKIMVQNYLSSTDLGDSELWNKIFSKLLQDKKQTGRTNDTVNFVLLKGFGQTVKGEHGSYTVPVSKQQMAAAWRQFIKKLS